jgi:hypothetical protein
MRGVIVEEVFHAMSTYIPALCFSGNHPVCVGSAVLIAYLFWHLLLELSTTSHRLNRVITILSDFVHHK